MKKCKNCVTLREEYEERCYPVIEDCGECPYYKGREDCAFSDECKDKPIEVFDKQGEFTPEFKDLVDSYIKEEVQKVTTNGKLDPPKVLNYLVENAKKYGFPPEMKHQRKHSRKKSRGKSVK